MTRNHSYKTAFAFFNSCNSSFGWWGAWLGELQDPLKHKTIVAPKNWFGPAHNYDSKDIIPERWTLL